MTSETKLSEVQQAALDALREDGPQGVDGIAKTAGRRVTWATMSRLHRLRLVEKAYPIAGGVVWHLPDGKRAHV